MVMCYSECANSSQTLHNVPLWHKEYWILKCMSSTSNIHCLCPNDIAESLYRSAFASFGVCIPAQLVTFYGAQTLHCIDYTFHTMKINTIVRIKFSCNSTSIINCITKASLHIDSNMSIGSTYIFSCYKRMCRWHWCCGRLWQGHAMTTVASPLHPRRTRWC